MCRIPLGEPKTPAIISQVHKTGSLEAQRCRAWFPKYALLYPLPSATSGRRFAIGSSKPTSTTSSSLGPLRPLRCSRYALRQPDDFVAGEYQTTSVKTTPKFTAALSAHPCVRRGLSLPYWSRRPTGGGYAQTRFHLIPSETAAILKESMV